MSKTEQGYYIWLDTKSENVEIPAWQELNNVIRKWVSLSGMEKDLSDYQKRKENQ